MNAPRKWRCLGDHDEPGGSGRGHEGGQGALRGRPWEQERWGEAGFVTDHSALVWSVCFHGVPVVAGCAWPSLAVGLAASACWCCSEAGRGAARGPEG